MKRLFALPVLLPLSAASAGPERYQVDAQVHIDGRLIGTPRLLVNEGVAGTVEMAGLEGYRFVASVSRDARTGRYHLRTEIAQPTANGGWQVVARPQVTFSLHHPLATGGRVGRVRYSLAVLRR
jgi:hypothetical protein